MRPRARTLAFSVWSFGLGACALAGPSAASGQPDLAAEPPVLFSTRLRVEPTQQRIGTLPRFEARWWLPGDDAGAAGPGLDAVGLGEPLTGDLRARIVVDAATGDATIVPDAALLDRFTRDQRRRWQDWLATDARNPWHRWPVVCDEVTIRAMEEREPWREAVGRIRRWGTTVADRMVFCDVFALEDAFATPRDRREFFQEAFGADTRLIKVVVDEGDAPGGSRSLYWHVNGRYRAIEPFLNAVAAIPEHDRIDIAHLLPRLPRALLYSYPPSLAEAEDPALESGMLAMEFFAGTTAGPGATETDLARWLAAECLPVTEPLQYGDILVYGDPKADAWPYAVVHIARGIVFGRRPVAFGPWVFMHRDEVATINPRLGAAEPRAFRMRRAVAPAEPPAYVRDRAPLVWRRQLALKPLPPGPWGRLWAYDVLLAPPGDVLEGLPPPLKEETWVFEGVAIERIRDVVAGLEGTPEVKRRLSELFAQPSRDDQGRIVVQPTLDLVLATPAEFRTRLFPHLAGGLGVSDPVQFIPFPTDIPIEQWFDTGSLPSAARDALLHLAYPTESGFAISDYGALYHVLEHRSERMAAVRAALRVPGLVVLMERPRPDEVAGLARYWATPGGRNVQQFLESVAACEDMRFIDVVHLLPPVPREFLNTYFMLEQPGPAPSCLWTAFNFGAEQPDPSYLVMPDQWTDDGVRGWIELMSSHEMIEEPAQLGDVIVYRRAGEDVVAHACTFVAGDVVYTKNGFTFSAPWHLARLEDVDALYLGRGGMEKVHFRPRRR